MTAPFVVMNMSGTWRGREIEAKPGAPIWHRDEAGQGYALKLTAAGLKAIAVDEGSQDAIEHGEAILPAKWRPRIF
jgi:hypothetical protein